MISSLQSPAYRIYFFGTLGQSASMSMQMVTGPLLIYRLTDSAALLGTMALVGAVPMIIVSLFGGAIADRIQKKQILIAGLICSALISMGVALALATGLLSRENSGSWWILMASSFCQGIIGGLMMPALQAMIPEIVSKEQLVNAVALNMLGMNVMSLVAPGIAGFMIDAFDFQAVYYIAAGLYVYEVLFILFIPRTSQIAASEGKILTDIQEGFDYIRRDSMMIFILAFTLAGVVLSMPYQQFLPIFEDNILKVGATGMGVLMSVSGVGALVGSLILTSLPNKKRGIMLLASGLISGLSLIGFALSSSWVLSLAFVFFAGLGQTIRGTIGSALLQTYTGARYMGRVMSIIGIQWGVMSLCTFLAGILAEVVAIQFVIGGLAIVLTIFSVLSMIFSPGIRKLD